MNPSDNKPEPIDDATWKERWREAEAFVTQRNETERLRQAAQQPISISQPKLTTEQKVGGGCGLLFLLALVVGIIGFAFSEPNIPDRIVSDAEWKIRPQLRDPSSFELRDSRVVEDGDIYVVVIGYRAKNGFGGYANGSAAFEYTKTGEFIKQRVPGH